MVVLAFRQQPVVKVVTLGRVEVVKISCGMVVVVSRVSEQLNVSGKAVSKRGTRPRSRLPSYGKKFRLQMPTTSQDEEESEEPPFSRYTPFQSLDVDVVKQPNCDVTARTEACIRKRLYRKVIGCKPWDARRKVASDQ